MRMAEQGRAGSMLLLSFRLNSLYYPRAGKRRSALGDATWPCDPFAGAEMLPRKFRSKRLGQCPRPIQAGETTGP
jgi:hypothetical protein